VKFDRDYVTTLVSYLRIFRCASVSFVKHAFIACRDRMANMSMHLYQCEDCSSATNIRTASTASFAKTF
jgi:hypothetical protein